MDDAIRQVDQEKFDEFETVKDGLGPLYNAQSCSECHQDPKSGGASQITELRVGHLGPDNRFQKPRIPIARDPEIITGRSLVNDRAICPNGEASTASNNFQQLSHTEREALLVFLRSL
ncbi:MAG: hypothetical protein ACREVA_06640 [Burkholderiales bacterium]